MTMRARIINAHIRAIAFEDRNDIERKKLNRRRFFHDRLRAFAVMEYWARASQTASTRQIMESSALRFIDDQRPLFTDIADGLR